MKKFLWLLPYFPYPAITGGNVRVFNLIKYLSEHFHIYLLSYVDRNISNEQIRVLEQFCKKVIVVKRKLYNGQLPQVFQHYYTPEMIDEVEKITKDKFDFIQIDFLVMAYYVNLLKKSVRIPIVYTEHDVSSFYFEKCFHNRHLPEKERFVEWVKMHEIIKQIYPLFNLVLTVSYNDANILKGIFPNLNISGIPTGTDCEYYKFKSKRKNNNLIYVGYYMHYPNIDAVSFFVKDIFPLIRRRYDLKFYIVGSGNEKIFEILNLKGNKNIVVTGTVPDIRDYLYSTGIFVSSIKLGLGIRGKILESMATGLPVVTTTLGAEGIGAVDGNHLLIADCPETFFKQIERLIEDSNLRKRLIFNARTFVEQNFDWPVIGRKLVKIYDELV